MRRPSPNELKNLYPIYGKDAVRVVLAIIDIKILTADLAQFGVDKTPITYRIVQTITDILPYRLLKRVSACLKFLTEKELGKC